jgi:hypothetical protein
MNRRFILVVIGLPLVFVAGSALAQITRPHDTIMKEIQTTYNRLKQNLDAGAAATPDPNAAAAATADSEKLQALFKEIEAFWAKYDTKDAIGFAQAAQKSAASMAAQTRQNDIKGALETYASVQRVCGDCHYSHRIDLLRGFSIRP